ncbi:MAG: nucleotidyltransferase family protein, partial [Erysipelotrichaceae bacterium]|nr:nucleotidyltransferase family protein [Erysipelotrichaceae bacterium]
MTKRITAIVVEYNPFHNGHRYHIEKARELTRCDVLIAIMSGNWTQRGEPAVCDKWERSRFVLDYGVDLVVELPFLHATQCATEFANAAIRIASLLGATDLVFGSEI